MSATLTPNIAILIANDYKHRGTCKQIVNELCCFGLCLKNCLLESRRQLQWIDSQTGKHSFSLSQFTLVACLLRSLFAVVSAFYIINIFHFSRDLFTSGEHGDRGSHGR